MGLRHLIVALNRAGHKRCVLPTWRELQGEFDDLMEEERETLGSISRRFLLAHVTRNTSAQESSFTLSEGPSIRNEYFRQKFLQRATDAGILLGTAHWCENATPAQRWIDRMFTHYKDGAFGKFVLMESETGGVVADLCEASATFCAWLDRINAEKNALGDTQYLQHTMREVKARGNARQVPREVLPSPRVRQSSTVTSEIAAKRMSDYIDEHGLTQTEFATRSNVTDRTIRSFRASGKIRKSLLKQVATVMGTTPELLLSATGK